MQNNPLLRRILSTRLIARWPVHVRKGLAEGARWTFFPWTSYWRGSHEPEVQARLIALCNWTGLHVWDLGSHYGLFAVGLGRRVGPTGSVAAFEPNPLSFGRMIHHIRQNKLSWVKGFPSAVSNTAGKSRFFLYDGLETTTSHLAYEGETWNESIPTMDVPSVRLDDLVAAGEINLPNFVKIDVEGHAHKALLGAAKSIAASRPILLIGLHSPAEIEGTLAVLQPLGYRISPILSDSPKEPAVGFDYLFEPV